MENAYLAKIDGSSTWGVAIYLRYLIWPEVGYEDRIAWAKRRTCG